MSKSKVNPIPEGYNRVIPYLMSEGVGKIMDFLKQVFDAEEIERMQMPDGTVTHGEVRIVDSVIMLAEAQGDYKAQPVMLYLYVEDVDSTYKKAIDFGMESVREPINEFYGDRSAGVKDHSGNQWWMATHVENVSPEEIEKRAKEQGKG